jgi:outer membrane biosynthesis protein TonB
MSLGRASLILSWLALGAVAEAPPPPPPAGGGDAGAKLVARFDIGPNGKVIGATADGIADRELIACVVQVVRKWEFEKPASGGKLRIAYPFRFEPRPTR